MIFGLFQEGSRIGLSVQSSMHFNEQVSGDRNVFQRSRQILIDLWDVFKDLSCDGFENQDAVLRFDYRASEAVVLFGKDAVQLVHLDCDVRSDDVSEQDDVCFSCTQTFNTML